MLQVDFDPLTVQKLRTLSRELDLQPETLVVQAVESMLRTQRALDDTAVSCPQCGATPSEPCDWGSKQDKRGDMIHASRRRRARRAS